MKRNKRRGELARRIREQDLPDPERGIELFPPMPADAMNLFPDVFDRPVTPPARMATEKESKDDGHRL